MQSGSPMKIVCHLDSQVTNTILQYLKNVARDEYANATINMSAFKGFSENQIQEGEGDGKKHFGKI